METRRQQQIRILTVGPRDANDWEEIKYLKDKGLARASIVLDPRLDKRGKILHLVWDGVTAHGRDFAEALLAQTNAEEGIDYIDGSSCANAQESKTDSDKQPNGSTEQNGYKIHESPFVQLLLAVLAPVIVGAIFWLINVHLGISLK
jgi:hypothetical protein